MSTVFLTLSVHHGFGKPLGDPFTHDTSLVLKYIAIQIPIVTLSTTIARSSFIIYLVAVLGTKKAYKILLWVILVIQLAGNIVSAVLPLSICKNVNVLWDPTVKTTCVDSKKVFQFAYFSNSKLPFKNSTGFIADETDCSFQLGYRLISGGLSNRGVLESESEVTDQDQFDWIAEPGHCVRLHTLHRYSLATIY